MGSHSLVSSRSTVAVLRLPFPSYALLFRHFFLAALLIASRRRIQFVSLQVPPGFRRPRISRQHLPEPANAPSPVDVLTL